MNSISKNIIFYITIVENGRTEQNFLRSVIHKVLPQAIVDSVKSEEEAVQYFHKCSPVPHLIFLDQSMLAPSGKDTTDLINCLNVLEQVPIVFISDNTNALQISDLIKQRVSHFYSRPYQAQDLLDIVGSVNTKWLA